MTWTYEVTNTGDATLENIEVSDDQEGLASCPTSTLAPGQSMTCTLNGVAPAGPYEYSNLGTVTAEAAVSCDSVEVVTDEDPSHYYVDDGGCVGGLTVRTV